MNETPNTRTAELFNAMVGAYETWAEPLSARLSQVALGRTTVSAGDCVLDKAQERVLCHFRQPPSARVLLQSIFPQPCVASCASCSRGKPNGGLKRTCLLVAQLTSTWRSHGALTDHSKLGV
jgi:hypothetical protein